MGEWRGLGVLIKAISKVKVLFTGSTTISKWGLVAFSRSWFTFYFNGDTFRARLKFLSQPFRLGEIFDLARSGKTF